MFLFFMIDKLKKGTSVGAGGDASGTSYSKSFLSEVTTARAARVEKMQRDGVFQTK